MATCLTTRRRLAALPDGDFTDSVLRPSRTMYTSARAVHALSKTHTLSAGYERNARRSNNLGVGNFDLPERAYSFGLTENLLRVSETGTLGGSFFNELRVQARWQNTATRPASDAPAVLVLDAFNRGGAQMRSDRHSSELEVAENLDFAAHNHAMRAGLLFEAGNYHLDSAINSGGTFTFVSLADFRATRPATFTQRLGRNPVGFSQYRLGGYWQDDMRLRQSLTLSFGLRYEWQNSIKGLNNFAPRIGLAWSPFKDGRTAIRAGAGIFYDWFDAETLGEILSADGHQQFDLVVTNPGFPNPFNGGNISVLPPSHLQRSPELLNPYIGQASFSVERQLTRKLQLTTSYLYQRGVHLLRGRDVNAPIPGLGRPDPTTGNVIQVESTASSSTHLLNLTLNSALSKRLYWLVDYTLSKTVNEADSPFSLPAENSDLRAERGPSSEDSRHHLFATAGLGLAKGLRLGTTFYFNSALPYNVTTGRDDNGDTAFNDRPPGTARNSARGAAEWDLSARLSWLFAFGDARGTSQTVGSRTVWVSSSDVGALASELAASEKRWRINLYLQALNLLNHANKTNYIGIQTSPFFGRPTAALPGRRIEVGMRFSF
jgi:hypothetical protein